MAFIARQALRMSPSSSSSPSRIASTRLAALSRHMSSQSGTPGRSELDRSKNDIAARKALESLMVDSVKYDGVNDARIYQLNREKALNSLNHEMIISLSSQIRGWKDSEKCKVIIGRGGERAFCAGGDVKQIILDARAGKNTGIPFFKDEFELNWLLGRLLKPYVLFMDGIIMGGGCGIGLPAGIRIATPRTHFAMPETKIGYAPDVGVNYYLAQLDGNIGAWLAVTGQDIFGRAVYELGLATHYVDGTTLPALLNDLTAVNDPSHASLSGVVASFSKDPSLPAGTLSSKKTPDGSSPIVGEIRTLLDKAFGNVELKDVYKTLRDAVESDASSSAVKEWARAQITEMDARSPTGMAVALEGFHRARGSQRLDKTLENDIMMASAFSGPTRPTDDFLTGVTAVLIDRTAKDQRPAWSPNSIEDVKVADIARDFFTEGQKYTAARPDLNFDPAVLELYPSKDETWGQFRRWGLPSEAELQGVVQGSSSGSGAYKVTLSELIDIVLEHRGEVGGPRKREITQRVQSIVSERCTEGKDGYLNWKKD